MRVYECVCRGEGILRVHRAIANPGKRTRQESDQVLGLPGPGAGRSAPANTMWRKLLYSGFKTCFGPSTQGAGTKTHLKSRCCVVLKAKPSESGAMQYLGFAAPACVSSRPPSQHLGTEALFRGAWRYAIHREDESVSCHC